MIIAQFEPREYYSKNEVDCLPTCVRALLDTFGLSNLYYKIIRKLSVNEYGYDFIEVATKLAENNILAEVGLYDTDYIPKLRKGDQLNINDLISLQKKKRKIPKHGTESLKEVCQFAEKYPHLVKIRESSFETIVNWLKKGLPVCLNVHLSVLKDSKDPEDDVMHSFILYGLSRSIKEIYIWDPASQFRIVEWQPTVEAWKAAGSYYLVMKNS